MTARTEIPAFVVKTMETDAEKDGKAFVHYTAWRETYTGLMPEEYLAGRSLERQRQRTYENPGNTLVAIADGQVVGFACYYPNARDFVSVKPAAEIGALYVLKAYQRRGDRHSADARVHFPYAAASHGSDRPARERKGDPVL